MSQPRLGSLELDFLVDAAHTLRTIAPETSAHLMSRRIHLIQNNREESAGFADVHRQHVCTCCGNIFLPGRDGDTLKFQEADGDQKHRRRKRARQRLECKRAHRKHIQERIKTKKTQPDAAAKTPTATAKQISSPQQQPAPKTNGPTKILTCGKCRSITKIGFPPPPAITRPNKGRLRPDTGRPDKTNMINTNNSNTTTSRFGGPDKSTSSTSKKRAKARKAGLQALLQNNSTTTKSFSLADFVKK